MPQFEVRVTKKISTYTVVKAADESEAKYLAWAKLPEHVDDWHCDVFNGTEYKVKPLEG